MPSAPETRRVEVILRKPRLGWYPKPTVVLAGRGQPAQWGTGTWAVPTDEPATVGVYLFNRLWRFGVAEIVTSPGDPDGERLVYRAPRLPFGRGRFTR